MGSSELTMQRQRLMAMENAYVRLMDQLERMQGGRVAYLSSRQWCWGSAPMTTDEELAYLALMNQVSAVRIDLETARADFRAAVSFQRGRV